MSRVMGNKTALVNMIMVNENKEDSRHAEMINRLAAAETHIKNIREQKHQDVWRARLAHDSALGGSEEARRAGVAARGACKHLGHQTAARLGGIVGGVLSHQTLVAR